MSECFVVVIQSLNRVWLFATPWTAAHQASLSFSISCSLSRKTEISPFVPLVPEQWPEQLTTVSIYEYNFEGLIWLL